MKSGILTDFLNKVNEKDKGEKREYIGASLIGAECTRQIWYEYKGFEGIPYESNLLRIFETGKRLESMLIDMLNESGCHLIVGNNINSNLEFFDKDLEYLRGHADAVIKNLNAILEIKTAKDSSFKKFVREGVKKWMPRYYAQIQVYMGMSGMKKAFILVINKDNSDICDEEIEYDDAFYQWLKERAKMVHEAVIPPPRVSSTPLWYQCRMCKFKEECHD